MNVTIVKGVVSLLYLCIPLTVFDETPVYSSLCDIAHNLNYVSVVVRHWHRDIVTLFLLLLVCAPLTLLSVHDVFFIYDTLILTILHLHWGMGLPPSLPTIYFFYHTLELWKYEGSLSCQMSWGFCIPQLLKLVYFSFYLKKKWKGYIWFFFNTVYIWSLFCVILCVWHVILMLFGVPPRAKSWRHHSSLNCIASAAFVDIAVACWTRISFTVSIAGVHRRLHPTVLAVCK